jgi:hypothetical protein
MTAPNAHCLANIGRLWSNSDYEAEVQRRSLVTPFHGNSGGNDQLGYCSNYVKSRRTSQESKYGVPGTYN